LIDGIAVGLSIHRSAALRTSNEIAIDVALRISDRPAGRFIANHRGRVRETSEIELLVQ
jgi:hypothetical protein